MLKYVRSPFRTLSGLLGVLCVVGAAAYTASVLGVLVASPVEAKPDDMQAVGLVQDTPDGPTGELYIRVDDGEEVTSQFLGCTGDPEEDPAACALLDERDDAFQEVAEDTVCTDTSYGPETASISGRWDGESVDTELSREGSCEEVRWQRLNFLAEPIE